MIKFVIYKHMMYIESQGFEGICFVFIHRSFNMSTNIINLGIFRCLKNYPMKN